MDVIPDTPVRRSPNLQAFYRARDEWHQLLRDFTLESRDAPEASLAKLSWIEDGARISRYLIKPVAERLLDQWGGFNESWRTSYPGNLVAIPLYDSHRFSLSATPASADSDDDAAPPIAFAKAYPTWPMLFTQGMVCMWLLTGYGPLGTLCRLDYPGRSGYPVLFTAYAGRTVLSANAYNYYDEGQPSGAHCEKALHPYYFTLKVLETLLLNHHTDEPNNVSFQAVADNKLNALGIKDTTSAMYYRLLSFDSEKKFVNPILKWSKRRIQLKVVSIVYMMSQMQVAPDKEALQTFINIDANALLTEWLNELAFNYFDPFPCDRNKTGVYLFSKREARRLFTHKPSRSYLPNLFYPGMLTEFYRAMRELQNLLRDTFAQGKALESHFALLALYQPRVAAIYQQAFKQGTTSMMRHKVFEKTTTYYDDKVDLSVPLTQAVYKRYAFSAQPIVSAHSKDSIRRAVRFGRHGTEAALKELRVIHAQWQVIDGARLFLQGQLDSRVQTQAAFTRFIDAVVDAYQQQAGGYRRFIQCVRQRLSFKKQVEEKRVRGVPESVSDYAALLLDDVLRMRTLNQIVYAELSDLPDFTAQQRWAQLLRLFMLGRYKHLQFRENTHLHFDKLRDIILASPLLVTMDLTGCSQLSRAQVELFAQTYCPFLQRLEF